jgi:2-keto-4-pentenoate hydratase/2-oxohepta-3-ene-1,7-dioic acid hydratase in catechol pathway
MRLGTLKDGQAIVVQDEACSAFVSLETLGFSGSVLELIQSETDELERLKAKLVIQKTWQPLEITKLAAPISKPNKIVAIGLNYKDHARETKLPLPDQPLVFTKFTSSITGPYDQIKLPLDITAQTDLEVELAVVIGKTARRVKPDRALEHVFGFTVVNDLTARDVQFADGQWVRSKSFDTFCPIGPVIITRDELPDPGNLRLGSSINGNTMQDSNTNQLVFGIPELIARLSQSFTLEAGDVLITGTPAGVGYTQQPAVFLQPGDTVRVWVEGIGALENHVILRQG